MLPKKCVRETVNAFYKTELKNPEETIEACKGMLAGWVLDLWDKGTLYKYHSYVSIAVTEFPEHGVVYLGLDLVKGKEWRCAGQSSNGYRRIVKGHESQTYRNSNASFLYFLRDQADEVSYLLPVSEPGLTSGPILNILEQWISLIFRTLQFSELKQNLDVDTLRWIPSDEMHKGVNIREPLAQGFGFNEFTSRSTSFKYSSYSLKREWHEIYRNRVVVIRRDGFLHGDIFEGSICSGVLLTLRLGEVQDPRQPVHAW